MSAHMDSVGVRISYNLILTHIDVSSTGGKVTISAGGGSSPFNSVAIVHPALEHSYSFADQDDSTNLQDAFFGGCHEVNRPISNLYFKGWTNRRCMLQRQNTSTLTVIKQTNSTTKSWTSLRKTNSPRRMITKIIPTCMCSHPNRSGRRLILYD